ncbi:hypothetical protein O0I10_010317 [Lichtheimia ornata]|uniref:Uncharacterized protein n=1 Tax=Lichtheimia ornata TaxID=688661 RepID=A0AAD7UXK1_9FUNG|nr:uncharacterized protein O0I10_010317 [Lichtheimia ornata]KAJ8653981.1 hypothetical protein O0I10_010317 [Lichtheimia ornata]
MESSAKDSQPWNRLDDIVQLSYTVTGVDVIYSQYNDTTWHLHILSDQNKYYYARYQGETQLEKLMQIREPPATSPSDFTRWLLESIIQGRSAVSDTRTFTVSDRSTKIEIPLEIVDDADAFRRISWSLLLKLVEHVQNEGCSIKSSHQSSGKDDQSTTSPSSLTQEDSDALKLKQQNELLNAKLKAVMTQHQSEGVADHTPSPPDLSTTSHAPVSQPAVLQPRRKGMSLINPRMKRRRHPGTDG